MKNRFASGLCSLLLSVLFTACVATSGINRTSSIAAPEAALGKPKTYAWYQDQPAAPVEFEKSFGKSLDKNLRQAIEAELKERGYQKVTSDPDLLVAYDVSVSVPLEKDAPGTYPPGFGYSYAYMAGYRYNYKHEDMPGYRSVDLFKQGTLIVDLVQPQTNELLWRGWSEEAISNFNASYKKVQAQVESVLEEL
ncbi:DUF4136 domain-containing protein [Pontibacter sp. SGAir0037]|uniref:DUF4136 domain-containing protein n=1 Tax=Pontibacter sp. SGAir0037 TaxID=2571030 RepID=UPI0010CCC425|nr:DUF4136 domain-containing protein [Pontibacter sp. SGAir0037]QCR22195.1 hypothetical protein C1N53_07455 [Pontibacter sp. SGAir0037]